MKKLGDVSYKPALQTSVWLSRLCYPIALSIEVKQPVTSRRLLEAAADAEHMLYELESGFARKSKEQKLARAALALRCVRAILNRLGKEGCREPARVTAAVEVSERLIATVETMKAS